MYIVIHVPPQLTLLDNKHLSIKLSSEMSQLSSTTCTLTLPVGESLMSGTLLEEGVGLIGEVWNWVGVV